MPSVLIRMRPDVYEIFPPFPFSPYRLQGIWRGCWTLPAICQILCHIRQRGKHPHTSPWEITDSFLHSLKPFHCKGVGFEARSWEQAFPKTLSVRVRVALSILFQVTLFVQEGRTRWLPEVPSSLNHAVILWTTQLIQSTVLPPSFISASAPGPPRPQAISLAHSHWACHCKDRSRLVSVSEDWESFALL